MDTLRVRLTGWTVFVISFVSGCATTGFHQSTEEVSQLENIVVTVDTTVAHNRTMKQALLSTPENETIAQQLSAMITGELQANGYQVDRSYRTVGLTSLGEIDLEINRDSVGADPTFEHTPFVFKPQSTKIGRAQLAQLQRDIAQSKLAPEPIRSGQAVMVINASGFYISGGEVAGNVAKGTVNTLVVIGAAASAAVGGGSGAAGIDVLLMEFNKDTLILTLQLFDLYAGNLLWEDYVRISSDPSADNFAKQLKRMLRKLPRRTS